MMQANLYYMPLKQADVEVTGCPWTQAKNQIDIATAEQGQNSARGRTPRGLAIVYDKGVRRSS